MREDVDNFNQASNDNVIPFRKRGKGERMLVQEDFRMVVKAKLAKSITYKKLGVDMVVPKGTNLRVDLDKMVALIDGPYDDYVDVSSDEILVQIVN